MSNKEWFKPHRSSGKGTIGRPASSSPPSQQGERQFDRYELLIPKDESTGQPAAIGFNLHYDTKTLYQNRQKSGTMIRILPHVCEDPEYNGVWDNFLTDELPWKRKDQDQDPVPLPDYWMARYYSCKSPGTKGRPEILDDLFDPPIYEIRDNPYDLLYEYCKARHKAGDHGWGDLIVDDRVNKKWAFLAKPGVEAYVQALVYASGGEYFLPPKGWKERRPCVIRLSNNMAAWRSLRTTYSKTTEDGGDLDAEDLSACLMEGDYKPLLWGDPISISSDETQRPAPLAVFFAGEDIGYDCEFISRLPKDAPPKLKDYIVGHGEEWDKVIRQIVRPWDKVLNIPRPEFDAKLGRELSVREVVARRLATRVEKEYPGLCAAAWADHDNYLLAAGLYGRTTVGHEPTRAARPAATSNGSFSAPTTGRALYARAKDVEASRPDFPAVEYLFGWGKLNDFPGRMIDWNAEQTALGFAELNRRLEGLIESGEPDVPPGASSGPPVEEDDQDAPPVQRQVLQRPEVVKASTPPPAEEEDDVPQRNAPPRDTLPMVTELFREAADVEAEGVVSAGGVVEPAFVARKPDDVRRAVPISVNAKDGIPTERVPVRQPVAGRGVRKMTDD
jgi:hypothetical protein